MRRQSEMMNDYLGRLFIRHSTIFPFLSKKKWSLPFFSLSHRFVMYVCWKNWQASQPLSCTDLESDSKTNEPQQVAVGNGNLCFQLCFQGNFPATFTCCFELSVAMASDRE
jgi:hypothetical protein